MEEFSRLWILPLSSLQTSAFLPFSHKRGMRDKNRWCVYISRSTLQKSNRTLRSVLFYQCLHEEEGKICFPAVKISLVPKNKPGQPNRVQRGRGSQNNIAVLGTHCCLGITWFGVFFWLFTGKRKGSNLNLLDAFYFYKQMKQEAWVTAHN